MFYKIRYLVAAFIVSMSVALFVAMAYVDLSRHAKNRAYIDELLNGEEPVGRVHQLLLTHFPNEAEIHRAGVIQINHRDRNFDETISDLAQLRLGIIQRLSVYLETTPDEEITDILNVRLQNIAMLQDDFLQCNIFLIEGKLALSKEMYIKLAPKHGGSIQPFKAIVAGKLSPVERQRVSDRDLSVFYKTLKASQHKLDALKILQGDRDDPELCHGYKQILDFLIPAKFEGAERVRAFFALAPYLP